MNLLGPMELYNLVGMSSDILFVALKRILDLALWNIKDIMGFILFQNMMSSNFAFCLVLSKP